MKTFLLLAVASVVVPFVSYFAVKWGMAGFYSAKRRWQKQQNQNHEES